MNAAESVGLPVRPFLYTIDQIALLLSVPQGVVESSYLYYEGRSSGIRSKDLISAVNIAKRHEKPEWRVAEREFVRWLRHKGFRVYETGSVVTR